MSKRTIGAPMKLFSIGLTIAAVMIGAEYVRAAVGHHDQARAAAPMSAAELDPVFVQKLAEQWLRPYRGRHDAVVQR